MTRGFGLKIRPVILCLSATCFMAMAASGPAYAGACTEAKMKADRQYVEAIIARGDLRVLKYAAVSVSERYWRNMSYAQRSVLAERVFCGVMVPKGSDEYLQIAVTWPRGLGVTERIVAVWSGGRLHERPLSKPRT
jgi:hypothetical protein